MNKKRFRQITAWLLLLLLAFAGGCGKGKAPASESASPSDNPGEVNTEGEKEQSMGRYLEYQIELPEEFEYADSWGASAIQTLESGEIALLEESMGAALCFLADRTVGKRSLYPSSCLSAGRFGGSHLLRRRGRGGGRGRLPSPISLCRPGRHTAPNSIYG